MKNMLIAAALVLLAGSAAAAQESLSCANSDLSIELSIRPGALEIGEFPHALAQLKSKSQRDGGAFVSLLGLEGSIEDSIAKIGDYIDLSSTSSGRVLTITRFESNQISLTGEFNGVVTCSASAGK